MSIIHLRQVHKEYPLGKTTVYALTELNLEIEQGEFLSIAGPSGSGKTTLLNLLGCIDVPTRGTMVIDGNNITTARERNLTQIRRKLVGFIFQSFNLIPVLNVYENVELPLLLKKGKKDNHRGKIMEMIDKVGLADQVKQRPAELSGGQRQRVAVARALITEPKIVLADEPTANLDSKTGEEIIDLMRALNQEENTTFIFATHDPKIIEHAKRTIHLEDGRISL